MIQMFNEAGLSFTCQNIVMRLRHHFSHMFYSIVHLQTCAFGKQQSSLSFYIFVFHFYQVFHHYYLFEDLIATKSNHAEQLK